MHDEEVQQLRDAVMRLRPEEQEAFLLRQNGELDVRSDCGGDFNSFGYCENQNAKRVKTIA